ncbi:MAG: ribonuclease HII [Chlamydiota bacterium]
MSHQQLINQTKFYFEREARLQGYRVVAGVDEAGRGPIAGPLVVAACILPDNLSLLGIDDSKKLSSSKREGLYKEITSHPDIIFSIVVIEKEIIDKINILQATLKGMQEAVSRLKIAPDYVLVDGNKCPIFPMPSKGIIQGDSLSYSIGAASILAKVTRDEIMVKYDAKWPEYGFAQHKGYPTLQHREILVRLGPSPIHRESYAPVKRAMELFLV